MNNINKGSMDKKNEIRIYIIVPVFNSRKYLPNCILSVLNQGESNIQLILVDDGSTDCSGELCDYYARHDKRVSVIHQKNSGQIIARQEGLKYIDTYCTPKNCDIVMFLDSDDTFKSDALIKVKKIMSDFSIDMMIFGMDRVTNGNIVIPYNNAGIVDGIVAKKHELYRIVFNDWSYNPVCAKALRYSLLQDNDYIKYSDVRYGEDLIQSLDYYKNSKKVFFYNESLYNYTVNPQSLTQTIASKPYSVDFRVRQLVMEFLISENVFNEQEWNEYRKYCMWLIADMLRTICLLDVSFYKKNMLIKQMRTSDYYCRYLQNKAYDDLSDWWSSITCPLFSKNHILTILVLGSVYKKMRELRNKMKEIIGNND